MKEGSSDVITLAGYPRSGKDTVAGMLERYGYRKVVFSELLRERFVKEKGREPTKMDLAEYGKELRERYGRGAVAELLRGIEGKVVLVGARSPEEVRGVLVWVEADEDVRRERGAKKERDEIERSFGIEELRKRADYVLYNNGTLEELEEQVKRMVEGLEYIRLGLRCGLEIHQQLDTGKLFCKCPSKLDERVDGRVERFLRPVPSETGEFDPAALAEFRKGLKYVYEYSYETSCLVELDEEPPGEPNQDALRAALIMANFMKMRVFPRVQFMRKIVIDGSNTTGFQRTGLIAVKGRVEIKGRRYGVSTLCLEEDSARPVERKGDTIVYRLDRLGIPLIEISTEPDMVLPEEVREVAERIGMLLRATGYAKRGLGTIRQDLNVSIKEGNRVEIKGVQQLDMIPEYVRREVMRQRALVEVSKEIGEVERVAEVTDILRKSGSKLVKRVLKNGKAMAMLVKKAGGLLGREVQPGRRFGTELADYVRVHAGLGGLLHSDELPGYGIEEEVVEEVKRRLGMGEGDGFILLMGEEGKVEKGVEVIRWRLSVKGVPREVRAPLPDGNTSYSRPMPGAARMYPETDVDVVDTSIDYTLPPLPEQRVEEYVKMGIKREDVWRLVRSPDQLYFDEMVKRGVEPKVAMDFVLNRIPYWRREGVEVGDWIVEVALAFERLFPKGAVDDVVREVSKGVSVEEAVDKLGVRLMSREEVRRLVEEVMREGIEGRNRIIGEVIRRSGGRASGKVVSGVLDELLKERE